jgi:hypothetical protein
MSIPLSAPRGRNRRASIVTMMVFALALAAAGASFIALTGTSHRINEANFSLHATQAVLERGVDQALYAFSKYRAEGYASFPAGWSASKVVGTGYSINLGAMPLGNGRDATIKVSIQNLPTSAKGIECPFIVAEAAYAGTGPAATGAFSRQIVVKLKATSNTGSGQGMVSKNKLTFKGNGSSIDSYTSWPMLGDGTPAPRNDDGTPNLSFEGNTYLVYLYGDKMSTGTNRSDLVTVASSAYATENFDPLSATAGGEIYGYVLIGGGDETALDKAVSGVWVHGANSGTTSGVDTSRTGTGYSADFTAPTIPTDYSSATAQAVPSSTTTTTGSGNNKVTTTTPGVMQGGASIPAYYTSAGLKLTDTLVVKGNVVLVMTGDIDISGQGQITIDNSDPNNPSSLTIYTPNGVSVTGNGIVNEGAGGAASSMTGKFTLNGTNTDKNALQNIKIAGNGAFSGLINAPFSSFTMGGGGNAGVFYGAVKAYDIVINGGGYFHYDTSLANTVASENTYPVEYWIEPKTKTSMKNYGI